MDFPYTVGAVDCEVVIFPGVKCAARKVLGLSMEKPFELVETYLRRPNLLPSLGIPSLTDAMMN
jgi:hypothetical protein